MSEAIIILGMHRSGTSCLTGCLKDYGLQLGDVSSYNKYNQKGNQEDRNIFRLNEAILKSNNGSWSSPPRQELVWDNNLLNKRKQVLDSYSLLKKPWGIKDPRMLFTYLFWKDVLPSHSLVGSIRHPLAVAKSLEERKNLSVPLEKGFKLWQSYNKRLLKLYERYGFPIIDFDLPNEKYIEKLQDLASLLNLKPNKQKEFFDSTLRNQKQYSRGDCPRNLLNLYDKLQKIAI